MQENETYFDNMPMPMFRIPIMFRSVGRYMIGLDPDTLPGFPGWSRLVKSHCTIPREDTVELHFKEGSKHMH